MRSGMNTTEYRLYNNASAAGTALAMAGGPLQADALFIPDLRLYSPLMRGRRSPAAGQARGVRAAASIQ